MAVIDNLDSESSTDSLSANQGRILNDRLINVEFNELDLEEEVTNIEARVTTLENNPSGSCDCETKIWTEPVA